MTEKKDQGHAIAVHRAMQAYSRARGGYIDYQTTLIYLLESLCRVWTFAKEKHDKTYGENETLPDFDMLYRTARRMADEK